MATGELTFTQDQLQNGFAAVEGQTVERCARLLDRIAEELASEQAIYAELLDAAKKMRALSRVYRSKVAQFAGMSNDEEPMATYHGVSL